MTGPSHGPAYGHAHESTKVPPRLSARLQRDTPLTVLRAPHGYGKSVLVAQWIRSAPDTGRIGVRVPPPHAREGAHQLWRRCAAALVAAGVLGTDPGDTASFEVVREGLAASTTPVRLALERLDLVTAPEVEGRILELVDRCPRVDVMVTVVGRSVFGDPVLLDPTHEILTGDDLLLTVDDLPDILGTERAAAADDHVAALLHSTGGMYALVDVARDLADGSADAAVAHHVRTRIVDAPDVAPHRATLIALASAPCLSVQTAQFLAPGIDAEAVLTELEDIGVADFRVTSTGPEWQVPTAIRRELRALQADAGLDPLALSTHLALHHRDRDDAASAIRCATEAQNWDLTVELVEEHWMTLIGGHLDLLRDVLLALPEDVVDRHPGFREGRELVNHLGGDLRRDSLPRDPAELRLLGSSDEVGKTLGLVSHQAVILRLAGRYDAAAELTERIQTVASELLEQEADDLADVLPFMRMQWGLTLQLAGAFAQSAAELRRAYLLGAACGLDYIARNAAGNSALNWALAGEPERVREWLDLELAHPAVDDAVESLIRIGGLVARIHDALDRLDTATATSLLAELDALPVIVELWPFVVHARSRHAITIGDTAGAIAVLDGFPEQRSRVSGAFVRALLAACEIDAHLAAGNGPHARLLATRTDCDTPWTAVAVARTHLIAGDHATAINTCQRFDWLSTPYSRSHLEALIIEAAAQFALGRRARANEVWRRACELADRTGIRSIFATIPRDVVVALNTAAPSPSDAVTGYLSSSPLTLYPESLPRPELTDREQQVLAGLAQGFTTSRIAESLFLSHSTVKTHKRTLFRKLGAHTRREAVTNAQELGLPLV